MKDLDWKSLRKIICYNIYTIWKVYFMKFQKMIIELSNIMLTLSQKLIMLITESGKVLSSDCSILIKKIFHVLTLLKKLCFKDIILSKNKCKLYWIQALFMTLKFWKRLWIYLRWFFKIFHKMTSLVLRYLKTLIALILSILWKSCKINPTTIKATIQIFTFFKIS